MSVPAPCSVHTPLLSDWLPAGVGLPMSAQLHWPMHEGGGGGGATVSVTMSIVTVLNALTLCEVTAIPASMFAPRLSGTVEPAIGDQVTPSADMEAVNEPAESTICRYTGTTPAGLASWVALPPCTVLYCTRMPLPGVTKTA